MTGTIKTQRICVFSEKIAMNGTSSLGSQQTGHGISGTELQQLAFDELICFIPNINFKVNANLCSKN
jgi:hypothetical protein